MHNCIEQGLLAQKADATVEEAIAALNRGEKPVITVANTMGSFIQAHAESQDLSPGDAMNLSFGDLLERYLERSRDVVVTDYQGHSTRLRLSDDQLGAMPFWPMKKRLTVFARVTSPAFPSARLTILSSS
ncbi:MAG: hypothetical protein WBG32_17240 [Nodosilinea sp.]